MLGWNKPQESKHHKVIVSLDKTRSKQHFHRIFNTDQWKEIKTRGKKRLGT